jgi:hypothetical protein
MGICDLKTSNIFVALKLVALIKMWFCESIYLKKSQIACKMDIIPMVRSQTLAQLNDFVCVFLDKLFVL